MSDYEDSHDVSFRDSDDQPCPNCGAVVDKFEETTRYDAWGGYECAECDVRWTWEEWADGVSKHPDPDEKQQAKPLNERLIGHAYRDIARAIEDGTFAVETPRVHAPKDTFEFIDWAVERDVDQHRHDGEFGITAGPPYLTIRLEWEPTDRKLVDDLADHGGLEGPCIVHGAMHLWRMDEQFVHEVGCMNTSSWTPRGAEEVGPAATAEFEWHSVEEVGWR